MDDINAHAASLVNVAQEMHKVVGSVMHPVTGRPLQMRIGIHTGKVVSGVIGQRGAVRYDIWGSGERR